MLAFYVKVIPPSGRARIHKGQCKYCRDGLGMKNQDKGTGPTYWYPKHPARGFQTVSEAENYMKGLGTRYEDTGQCPYCMKGLIDDS